MDQPSASGSSLVELIVNHIALPPRLPGTVDARIELVEHELTKRVEKASRTLGDLTHGDSSFQWECVRNILRICREINAGGKLERKSLVAELRTLQRGNLVIAHVAEQNAGLLIRRDLEAQEDTVIFEAFEAAPPSEKILAAGNALQSTFPGRAASIPFSVFSDVAFQDNLASFLEQASTESIKRFAAHAYKSGSLLFESRHSVDAAMITQLLMALLEANGTYVSPPLLRKRVRDDVCWNKGAEKPWRRCPYWLVLRVGVQRHLCGLHGGEMGTVYYKFLICVVIAHVMDDALDLVSPDLLALIKAKLARRISKLVHDQGTSSTTLSAIYVKLFATVGPTLQRSLARAADHMQRIWDAFKMQIKRPIRPLPKRADPRHLRLTLNCQAYLQKVISTHMSFSTQPHRILQYSQPLGSDISQLTAKYYRPFANRYFALSKLEEDMSLVARSSLTETVDLKLMCSVTAEMINRYMDSVGKAYDLDPEQMSIMLLTVLKLWVLMDRAATKSYSLLLEYSPGIPPEILDVVRVTQLSDMVRLQEIQAYLRDRYARCGSAHRTIFSDPSGGCFAERYFQESDDAVSLHALQSKMKTAAQVAKERKEKEWRRMCGEFEDLERRIAESTCLSTLEDGGNVHDERHCKKCFMQRQSRRMKIRTLEHLLPSDSVQAQAVVFELGCPEALRAYRNTTWRIIATLTHPPTAGAITPKIQLCDYPGLNTFVGDLSGGVSLASTRKSIHITHYNEVRLPVPLDQVCLPNGLKWAYYDSDSKTWPGRQTSSPNLAHLFKMPVYGKWPTFVADADGPSSYEVLSSQPRCPTGLNLQEFTAYQTLFSGPNQRWATMLLELGSSNLNFSTEAVALAIDQLATQAGPSHGNDPLRAAHRVLREDSFCERLLEQLDHRLSDISSNWRETNVMNMLLTLILRLIFVASRPVASRAMALIQKARAVTLDWVRQLRVEIHSSKDASSSQRHSNYAFLAALLCRRSFAIHAKGGIDDRNETLQPAAVTCFVECSITMQDSFVGDPAALPLSSRNALIRDLKLVRQLGGILRRSIEAYPTSLQTAINNIWPQAEGDEPRSYSEPVFLEVPEEWWLKLNVDPTHVTKEQTVHYHVLEGHLLIDYQPLGKLPAQHRASAVLTELFGEQRLLTYPSSMRGMTYMLGSQSHVNGHQIHIGFRDGALFVQACFMGTILEYIPRQIFGEGVDADLPSSLVENCVHWLDVRIGVVEIRQQPDIWQRKLGNWTLDLNTRIARRRKGTLVDPHSTLFHNVAQIFHGFEEPWRLTVFQPEKGRLAVELRRLELAFFVNDNKLLECRELKAEIDSNQDIGTLYGLRSNLVLRDMRNARQRMTIVPLGQIQYRRHGCHVMIQVANDGLYGRFTINDVLGRLECAPEPMLLYLKVKLHAYTTFVLPDPLTGRTGTEEALNCLNSGYCQPWTAPSSRHVQALVALMDLSPRREWYPRELKTMQQVSWDDRLTTTIQHDAFRLIVEKMYERSKRLRVFNLTDTAMPPIATGIDPHLVNRALSRRLIYERPDSSLKPLNWPSDLPDDARCLTQVGGAYNHVLESVKRISHWSPDVPLTRPLAEILGEWPNIGGFDHTFDKLLLSDCLDVQFPKAWGSLANLCSQSGSEDKYKLMFLLSLISFRNDVDMNLVHILISFAILGDLKSLQAPQWPQHIHFRYNTSPSVKYIVEMIKSCHKPYVGDARDQLYSVLGAKARRKLDAEKLAHEQQCESDSKALAEHLLAQWPSLEPTSDGFPETSRLDVAQALTIIRPEWLRLFQNLELSVYVQQVQKVLDSHCLKTGICGKPSRASTNESKHYSARRSGYHIPLLSRDLINKSTLFSQKELSASSCKSPRAPTIDRKENQQATRNKWRSSDRMTTLRQPATREIQELESILNLTADSSSTVERKYGEDMRQSLQALNIVSSGQRQDEKPMSLDWTRKNLSELRLRLRDYLNQISHSFEQLDPAASWLRVGGLWPCITTVTLLEQLRSTSAVTFGEGVRESLIRYAVIITELQRLLRIEDAHLKGRQHMMLEEQKNSGHSNWQPLEYPDWLLLEIDTNIMIRPDQVDVAFATISPASGKNSVLQLMMGKGKTSCIMPMAAAVLADTKKLVRVVVPKALLLQTAQLLQARLGGLVGREVRHVPFSRKTLTNSDTIGTFFELHKEIRSAAGVIITLPEHMLSFKLSGRQRLLDARVAEATQMVKVQSWIERRARDIIDECDFTLAIRTQLIYPSGSQTTVDGAPHRWETAEALLRLVEGHLWNLQNDFPHSIEVLRRTHGGFPQAYFLRRDVEDALLSRLTNDLVRGQASIVPVQGCSRRDLHLIREFISEAKVRQSTTERIAQLFPDNLAQRHNIYLLRGLLVHRILLLALKKRWNVQYGLHPGRDPIAVPFHAKGVPSEQSEWGHPDVAILFTCLAFYFGGLGVSQLRQSLESILKSDDPSSEWDRWTQNVHTLPDSLREWNLINVDDENQLEQMWQHMRFEVVIIDYYLNRFVFPKHAKQFGVKLQASGWDIPLFESEKRETGKGTASLTTGFSGTNDNRIMLPLTIAQEDLQGLSHTNAEVLTYLLQPRNRSYVLAADERCRHLTEIDLLRLLCRREIRTLIDAGALILEMDNHSLVKEWLKVDWERPAAVYFDEENKPFVQYRKGNPVPLVATPFAENLGDCLVYLDEAHTRGTDLKLPPNAKGALTLGLGQTKDHTVQAAMRLRQLATTQSVEFFAPPEVHQSILDIRTEGSTAPIDSYDVICWLFKQSCDGTEQMQPLHYSHGTDFCRRTQAALDNPDFLVNAEHRERYVSVLRQDEQQTLEQLYKPKIKARSIKSGPYSPVIAAFMKELNTRRKGFQDTGAAVQSSALQEVEQEREVAYEIEAVREVQKPIYFPPLQFPGLHKDVLSFMQTGRLSPGEDGYEPAFAAVKRTGLGRKYAIKPEATSCRLFVSRQFSRTVKLPVGRSNDNFMRQVTWLLWSSVTSTALIVIPEEAELLLARFRPSGSTSQDYDDDAPKPPLANLISYAAPVTRKMLQNFNGLNFYALPPLPRGWKPPTWLTVELGVFAGRLYFDFAEYSELTRFLGIDQDTRGAEDKSAEEEYEDDEGDDQAQIKGAAASTTEQSHAHDQARGQQHQPRPPRFASRPLTFLQEWLALRRRGQDVTHTPMGYVCQGKALTADHPFFKAPASAGADALRGVKEVKGRQDEAGAIGEGAESEEGSEGWEGERGYEDDEGEESDESDDDVRKGED